MELQLCDQLIVSRMAPHDIGTCFLARETQNIKISSQSYNAQLLRDPGGYVLDQIADLFGLSITLIRTLAKEFLLNHPWIEHKTFSCSQEVQNRHPVMVRSMHHPATQPSE